MPMSAVEISPNLREICIIHILTQSLSLSLSLCTLSWPDSLDLLVFICAGKVLKPTLSTFLSQPPTYHTHFPDNSKRPFEPFKLNIL